MIADILPQPSELPLFFPARRLAAEALVRRFELLLRSRSASLSELPVTVMSRSGVEAMKTRSPNGDMVTGIGLTSAWRGSLSMIKSMLSPCPDEAVERRSFAGAGGLPSSGAAAGGSELATASPPTVLSSAGGEAACSTTSGGRRGFLRPVRAMPVLLNPTMSTGTGTSEVRGDASSVRPR